MKLEAYETEVTALESLRCKQDDVLILDAGDPGVINEHGRFTNLVKIHC